MKKTDLNKKIGQRVIDLRTKQKMSQADLARALGKDRQAVERLENGKTNPTVFTLYEIARALDVPLTSLVDIKIG